MAVCVFPAVRNAPPLMPYYSPPSAAVLNGLVAAAKMTTQPTVAGTGQGMMIDRSGIHMRQSAETVPVTWWGKIVTAGPDGAPDRTDAWYWVEPATAQDDLDEPFVVTGEDPIQCLNLLEWGTGPTGVGTHAILKAPSRVITKPDRFVRVIDGDEFSWFESSPSCLYERYVFDVREVDSLGCPCPETAWHRFYGAGYYEDAGPPLGC